MSPTWENVKVDNSNMRLYLSAPESATTSPAVIVIQGQTGVDDFLKFSDMVAREGICRRGAGSLSSRSAGLQRRRTDAAHEAARCHRHSRCQRTVNFLKSHKSVDPAKIGIVGFCMGGRVVYLMSAVNPDIKAGVMYYGSDPFSSWGDGPSPFERSKDISGPIMGHFGEDDKNPSPADMKKLDAELTRLGKPHEFHSYPNAAHAFANFGSGNYREHAANASWPRTFEFFTKNLMGA